MKKQKLKKCDRCGIGEGTHNYDMSKYLLCEECHSEWDKWYSKVVVRCQSRQGQSHKKPYFSLEDEIWHEVFAEFMGVKPPKVKVILI
jgi:formate dehydrogenase maturation protein FdhE